MVSAVYFAVVCKGSGIRAGGLSRLHKVISRAGSVIGCKLGTLEAVVKKGYLNNLLSIRDNLGTLCAIFWTGSNVPPLRD